MRTEIVEALKILNKALDKATVGEKYGITPQIVDYIERLAKLIKE